MKLEKNTADSVNELLSSAQLQRMLDTATYPDIHNTIAPTLLGSPSLPRRNYGAGRPDLKSTRFANVWCPPAPSLATRRIPLLSNVSVRSISTNPSSDRLVTCESLHEHEFLTLCLVDPRVHEIQEQPGPPMIYRDQNSGKERSHHFDFLVTMNSGRKVAVAVKPEAHRSRADYIVAYCNQNHRGKLADTYVVRTRANMSRRAVANASLLLWARRFRNPLDVQRMEDIARASRDAVSTDVLWARFGALDAANVATLNLIDDRKLELVEPKLIAPGVLLKYVGPEGDI